MISLEIMVNGQRRAVAGVEAAELLTAKVSLYPAVRDGWLEVSGSLVPADQPPADANWLSAALTMGDSVEIRLVDSAQAQTPTLSRIDPTAPATDAIPMVCAFCEKGPPQVEGMVSARKAMICRHCVGYLHEMMNASSDASDDAVD